MDAKAHWHGVTSFSSVDRLARLSFHRVQDTLLLKKLELEHRRLKVGDKLRWRKEIMVLKLKEEWRTAQEDSILEVLYRMPFINGSGVRPAALDAHPQFLETINFEDTIRKILQPTSNYRSKMSKLSVRARAGGRGGRAASAAGSRRSRSRSRSRGRPTRVKIISFPKLLTLNLKRQNGSILHVESFVEHVGAFRHVVRESKRKGRASCYDALLARIERSRTAFSDRLNRVCAKLDQQARRTFKGDSKGTKLKHIAMADVATKLDSLKAHSMASKIQAAFRKFKLRRIFRQKLAGLRTVRLACERKANEQRIARSARTVQAALRVILVRRNNADRVRGHRVGRMTLRSAARRIARWYVFWRSIRRSRAAWTREDRERWDSPDEVLMKKIVAVQMAIRGKLSRNELLWRRAFQRLRARRARKRVWQATRMMRMVGEVEENMVLTKFYVAKEHEKVDIEIDQEQKRFSKTWELWQRRSKLGLDHKKLKLPGSWTSYRDPEKGVTIYTNHRTGQSQRDHPGIFKFKQVMRKKLLEAEKFLQSRLGKLAKYRMRLRSGERAKMLNFELEKWDMISAILKKERVQGRRVGLRLNTDGSLRS